jgi:hypothetical protein
MQIVDAQIHTWAAIVQLRLQSPCIDAPDVTGQTSVVSPRFLTTRRHRYRQPHSGLPTNLERG